MSNSDNKISVIGLGYVGLPLAMELSSKYQVKGFDLDTTRIEELNKGVDRTLEVSSKELIGSQNIIFTDSINDISDSSVFIVTVPTPIDKNNKPDLRPLVAASESLGKIIKDQDLIIYESTVYPGVTEEICGRVLEEESGLKINKDFFLGYSPERINPGDKEHKLTNITKVISGSSHEACIRIDRIYSSIISAGTFMATSIKVAEAAKVIENTQRDVNIALINELSKIFNRMDIDTQEVLEAAETKWNFLSFRPGLVGGHCIGVDPYYLTHKAISLGYSPEIILSGREINNSMPDFITQNLITEMSKKEIQIKNSRVLVMGLSFKENCPDIRNTKVIDIIKNLEELGIMVDCYDPWVSSKQLEDEYNICLNTEPGQGLYDGIIVAVAHNDFKEMGIAKIRKYGKKPHVLYDLKYLFSKEDSDLRL